jgi:hypothetical protein
MAKYNESGHEIGDATKISVTPRRQQQMNREDNIAALVAREFSRIAEEKQSAETIEESLDFEIEDLENIFPESQFEVSEMTPEYLDSEYAGLSLEEIAIRETAKLKTYKEEAEHVEAQEVQKDNNAEQTERETTQSTHSQNSGS